MLIGGGLTVRLLENYRSVWLAGHPGSGKTALAVRLAYELLSSGFVRYCVSNIPLVFADRLEDIKPSYEDGDLKLNTVVILDEAGLYLQTGKDAQKFTAFLRKMNVVLILASVEEVASDLRKFIIERSFDGRGLGIPVWFYRYYLTTRYKRENDKFIWAYPQEVFGLYQTGAVPTDDANISDFLGYWVNEAVKLYKAKSPEWRERAEYWQTRPGRNIISALETSGRGNEYEIVEAAKVMESAAESISLSFERAKRKR